MTKINLLTEDEIPIVEIDLLDPSKKDTNQLVKSLGLSVYVDDLPAYIFIRKSTGFMSNEKVVIIFENYNERWPEGFQTKYYIINTPGLLEWGHKGEKMSVSKRI